MSRFLRFSVTVLRASWRTAPALTVCLVAVEAGALATTVGLPLALRAVVDASAQGAAGTALTAAVAAAALCTLTAVINCLHGSMRNHIVDKVAETELRPEIARLIATLESTEHLERSDFLDRVTVLRGASWGLVEGTWSAVTATFVTLRLTVTLLLLSSVSPWLLTLLAFAVVPLSCNKRGRSLVTTAETASAEAFRVQRHLFEVMTSADGGKELRVSGAAGELARLRNEAWDDMVAVRFRARLRATGWRLLGWAGFTLGFLAALVAVIHAASTGAASAGDLVLAVTVASTLESSVQMAVTSAGEALEAERLIEPYLWLTSYAAAEQARATGASPPPTILREGIVLDDVGYTHPGASRPALEGVSVRLPAGSVVAVVGEFGSGKTTLVKLLSKFYRPSSGTIRVDGTPLADLDTDLWRARTSAAYQDFGRYPQMTFSESVGLGDLKSLNDREQIVQSVREADAEALAERLPDGLDTHLGRAFGGVDLSGGQWQKTALARASMRPDPLLLVLDEPTASLDAPSEHAVFERYMKRARLVATRTGAVTVLVSHRFSTVAGADLILVLRQGRLVEHGRHEELLAEAGTYGDLYGLQADAYDLGRAAPRGSRCSTGLPKSAVAGGAPGHADEAGE